LRAIKVRYTTLEEMLYKGPQGNRELKEEVGGRVVFHIAKPGGFYSVKSSGSEFSASVGRRLHPKSLRVRDRTELAWI
jgi:hypothetical protein